MAPETETGNLSDQPEFIGGDNPLNPANVGEVYGNAMDGIVWKPRIVGSRLMGVLKHKGVKEFPDGAQGENAWFDVGGILYRLPISYGLSEFYKNAEVGKTYAITLKGFQRTNPNPDFAPMKVWEVVEVKI